MTTAAPRAAVQRATSSLRRFGVALLDALAPPRCAACDSVLEQAAPLCEACMALLHPMRGPLCHRCGVSAHPRADDLPHQGDLCRDCIHFPPSFDQAWAAYAYDGVLAEVLPHIKYGKDLSRMRDLAGLFAPRAAEQLLVWRALHGIAPQVPLVLVPMPMHRKDVLARGFSQTMALAASLARAGDEAGVVVAWHALEKHRRTAPQASLGVVARRANLTGSVRVREQARCEGAVVVLIDDVMTTGATAHEAALACRQAGARQVFALTLARAL